MVSLVALFSRSLHHRLMHAMTRLRCDRSTRTRNRIRETPSQRWQRHLRGSGPPSTAAAAASPSFYDPS
jgi:hypothetical protein